MNDKSKKDTKAKAAAARAAAEAAEKRRRRTVTIAMVVGLVVVVGAIIVLAVLGTRKTSEGLPAPDPNAALPATVLGPQSATPYAVPVGNPSGDVRTVEVWFDFQCPFCAAFETTQGSSLSAYGKTGAIRLVNRATAFLDVNLPQSNYASARATNAYGCSLDAGKGEEYKALVFANQPPVEGIGWTDEALVSLGKQAGITGSALDTFTTCVNDRTYYGWVADTTQAWRDAAVAGTPRIYVDGEEVPSQYINGTSVTSTTLVDYLKSTATK